jgi:NAD(P)-dependent dehydrogenase (short-subunit alcohol dehydrogenase family)
MSRRVALVSDGAVYVGPHLARALAAADHDVVVGDPEDGLADQLRDLGAEVVTVERTRFLIEPDASDRLVAAAVERFGRIDAAVAFTGRS